MMSGLQFIVITAFLIWGLVSSVCGLFTPSATDGQLVWREHGPDGWHAWRPAHFGLTAANLRVLQHPGAEIDGPARAALLDTVLQQQRRADSDAVQFAVVRRSPERVDAPVAVFVSEGVAVTPDQWEMTTTAA